MPTTRTPKPKAAARPARKLAVAPDPGALPATIDLRAADRGALEAAVTEAVRLASEASTSGAHAYRLLAERLVDLRIALDDLDGRTEPYRQARHRAFYAGGVTDAVESARLERNVRYHAAEVLVERGLKAQAPSRQADRRGASPAALAVRALASLRRAKRALEADPGADTMAVLDALDEIGAAVDQLRRRIEAPTGTA